MHNALTFLIANNPFYYDVELNTDSNLHVDDIPEEIWKLLHCDNDPDNEAADAHSTYTPQTDLNDVPSDGIVMSSSGMVDLEGSSVRSNDQMNSAIHTLQGTLYVPHGTVPLTVYNNPNLWLGSYPWLFPYGTGGPEIERKERVTFKSVHETPYVT